MKTNKNYFESISEKIQIHIDLVENNPIEYIIGSFSDGFNHSYCLISRNKKNKEVNSIILVKSFFGANSLIDFKKEVENLSNYFNAKIIKEIKEQ
jgi:hypothetical protein